MQLTKSNNHSHFWVEDCILYESYNTIRGKRYRQVRNVLYPDTERLTEEQIKSLPDEETDSMHPL